MAWVKLDDRFDEHPKVVVAGEDAAYMFVRGLAYSNRNDTGGFIPEAKVAQLTTKKNAAELARRLVTCGAPMGKAGLWEPVEGGYRVHDYEDYQPQPSPEERQIRDAHRSEAKRRAGAAGGRATQQRAPGVIANLRQHRSGTEAEHTEAHRSTTEAGSTEAAPKRHRSSAPPKHTEAHRSPDPDPVLLSHALRTQDPPDHHAGAGRVGVAAPAGATWSGADLEQLWVGRYQRPAGDAHAVVQLAHLVRDTAAARGLSPAALAPRLLEAFGGMLADWKARKVHHGAPRVQDAIEHFSTALDWLDAPPERDEAPVRPEHQLLPRLVRPRGAR